jgi:alanine-synthesizing transaminase
MFDEIQFNTIDRLPPYVFAQINDKKLELRRLGQDIIDFSMGNPSGPTPEHIVEKLVETARKGRNHGYSTSKGIYKLRLAICNWYKRKYGVELDPDTEAVSTMGSKEGYVHLVQAVANAGDVAVVPDPAYPIHTHAFIINGANVINMPLVYNEKYELDVENFFKNLNRAFEQTLPKPKFVVVNFPHNPSTVTVEIDFYERLVELAKKKRFYIISDIAYAELTFDGYKTPSILQVDGAKDVAVESYTLSKTYNMAGWRVGFVVGNSKMVTALQKIKSWLDYGTFTPIQVAATVALDEDQSCVNEIIDQYKHRRDILIESFKNAGWEITPPRSSMFVWARLPEKCLHMGSLKFTKDLLEKASVAVSPGIGFGDHGDNYVRIALIENPKRIRQAARNIKTYLNNI